MQIHITLNGAEALADRLEQYRQRAADTRALHEIAATVVMEDIEENFASESWMGAGWTAWSPVTARRRAGGKILQDSGHLAGSITSEVGADRAAVGTGLAYAPIHQFGGNAGRGRKVKIPARPFLPIDGAGLVEATADAIIEGIDAYMERG